MNPLKSIPGTIISGFALAVVISLIFYFLYSDMERLVNPSSLIVWLHVVFGIVWIGLLYYFNFVQVPGVAEAMQDDEAGGAKAINKHIAPRALAWFRYSALLTWLSGAVAVEVVWRESDGGLVDVFLLNGPLETQILGVGAWLGTIMLLNVWGLIWPNQKKILDLAPTPATAEEKAKAKKIALMASRTNTLLSVPMLMCMIGGGMGHGMPISW